MAEEKQFGPSAKRLKKAVEEGKTPKSKLLPFGCGMSVLLLLLEILVPSQPLIDLGQNIPFNEPLTLALLLLKDSMMWVGKTLGAVAVVLTLVTLLLTKCALATKAVHVEMSALNPASGFMRLCSEVKKVPVYLVTLTLIVSLTCVITYGFVRIVPTLLHAPRDVAWVYTRKHIFNSAWLFALCALLGGGIELFWNWRKFRREFGMSLEDLKKEHKEDNGDPHIRAERRALQEALLFEELPRRVKNARVIIAAPRMKRGHSL